ncbi:GTP cyclohydrolase 1 [Algimonas ampicilliniresistens]|jgi:GTP cyclohydrolase I|uniref:GTP cyclohydrolase I n=1 Tax=Algimonas ampicilliniresistens TaxID=1298735 RepID=A0ABQ5V8K4_9PROT|nr:GTP cyclohydrolase I [Algimonas ampicilliniresistens]GLQ22612.1 GTP cyclohydrolase 1 [Algimonas ampicilliniresistens]
MPDQHRTPKTVDHAKVKDLVRELLIALGENPDREGLLDTPRRIADFWRDFIEYDPGKLETTFDSVRHNQMVAVTGMRVWSMCEHHMLPFWCDVSVAYIAHDKVLGLSKFARIAHKNAHALSLQEKLVADISDDLKTILGTKDVAVVAKGEHLCMTMRGIKTPHRMISSALDGQFLQAETRAEFFNLVNAADAQMR